MTVSELGERKGMNIQTIEHLAIKESVDWIPLEGLMLKLKLQYFGHLMQRTNSFIGKDADAGKD